MYDTPYVVVATLPVARERVVLVRRATEPGRGLWSYPGGYLEMGETLEEGAVRETREEIGLDVDITGLLGVYSRPGGRSITVVFQAEARREDWDGGPEVLEVDSFRAAEIPWRELAFWTAQYALEDWVRTREHNLALPRAWRVGPAAR
jgi:ADP-ribose pyrophosphatase YjhB (NUDIX family)